MGRANVMEPIHEKNMNQMIALQGIPSQLAYKKMDESSTILKLPPLLPNKNMKYADESHSAPLTSTNLHHEQEDKILLGTSETTTVVAGSIAKLQGRQILH
ncbi:Hypothetical predicted protein [Mytilus galloprovincialis]|uniref:Uncharacterized protein n=1 Tax=Mytilus galloprovincialis TaxID=29158 RepID=A0A8B6DZ14_MYTGA|nr:Hypothetical predicted protein [Mytilus galloprovincialis]